MPEPESRAPSWPMNATSDERRDPHDARLARPPRATPVDERREHVAVGEAVDRLRERVAERRPDRDHDLVRPRRRARAGPSSSTAARRALRRAEQARVDRVRQPLQPLPALALEAVARARARCTRFASFTAETTVPSGAMIAEVWR